MIRETRRPLLADERPRIQSSLDQARRGGFFAVTGRVVGLMALWLFGLVLANTAARFSAPASGEPPDRVVLVSLQIAVTLVVFGAGIPILIRSLRLAAAERRANIALYSDILRTGEIPVIEVNTSRVIRFIDHLDLGDCFLCEVEPTQCVFLVGGPDEEIIKSDTFPTNTFEVVSYGTGDDDPTVRPTGEVFEPMESLSVKEIHWPDWEHAEVIPKSMDECMAQVRRKS